MKSKLLCARFDAAVASDGPFPFPMAASEGTGFPLVKRGPFGADLIRFAPGEAVGPHTHPGDHILICVRGKGKLWYDGEEHDLDPGFIYLVPGSVPHAVYGHPEGTEDLVLFSVGNDHRPVDSRERLEVKAADVKLNW